MKKFILAGASLCIASVASAATLTQTVNFDHTSNVASALLPLTFDRFDSSLGTLTEVKLVTTGSYIRNVSVVVNGSFGSGTYNLEVDGNMRTSGVGLLINRDLDFNITGTASNGTVPLQYTRTFAGTSTITPLASHIGSGTFNLGTQFVGTELNFPSSFSSGTPASFVSQKTTGQANLIYTYEPVPEPATLAILAAGLGFCARRKRARS